MSVAVSKCLLQPLLILVQTFMYYLKYLNKKGIGDLHVKHMNYLNSNI
jgi:hypothetical protein